MRIELLRYDELSPELREHVQETMCLDQETTNYLVSFDKDGNFLDLESYYMEPCDASFTRDLS
jgi:hypothetical protein